LQRITPKLWDDCVFGHISNSFTEITILMKTYALMGICTLTLQPRAESLNADSLASFK
jgi:hypothetical protein